MTGDKQIQKAGDYSQQIQAGTVIINQGIDEKRAREIYKEEFEIARRDFTQEAIDCAIQRAQQVEDRLLPKMLSIEGAINHFSDPAFQVLLRNAQRTAIVTEREADYDMLAELLVCHIEKGEKRKTRTGISKAIEIVDKIDDDALCALTIMYAIGFFHPIMVDCKQGILVLEEMFNNLEYMDLPMGSDWIEHLEILNAVRANSVVHFKSFEDYFPEKLLSYNPIGIKKESREHEQAVEILSSASLSSDFLVRNDLMPDYVKLPFSKTENYDDIVLTRSTKDGIVYVPINDNFKKAFNEVFRLYSKSDNAKMEYKHLYMDEWNRHKSLSIIREWWGELPFSFDITHIGKVLAYTNVKRCYPSIPDFPLNF